MSTPALSSVPPAPPAKPPRIESVDLLRGLVMVVMALDHVRDFFSNARFDPVNLNETSVWYFLTRWFTHYCAPNFVFLAGTGAFLGSFRGKSKADLSWFLWTRGLWLVLLELTVVRWGWSGGFQFQFTVVQAIWSLGWSMVALSGLVWLPMRAIAGIGVGMAVLHNFLDPWDARLVTWIGWPWRFLHAGGMVEPMAGKRIIALYPLVPWIGVMAAGYCFGTLLTGEQVHRRRRLIQLGLALCGLFILVRAANVYGDPRPWAHQKSALFTALSFLNCTKYPPSLQYLLMTIGPGILFLGLADRPLPSWTSVFIVFGRVPLFYYVLHVPLIRMSAVLANKILHPAAAQPAGPMGAGQGFGLGGVYLAWILIVIVLYFPCRWFADVKRRRRDPWLSYL